MKKTIFITLAVLIAVAGIAVYKYPHQSKQLAPIKHCQDAYDPCYKIVMAEQPDLYVNEFDRHGKHLQCILFKTVPEGIWHDYCPEFSIVKLHN